MPPRDGQIVPPTKCCVNLRCKTMYSRADERRGLLHASESITYWCGTTNEESGPDEGLAAHARCQPGRGCYREQ